MDALAARLDRLWGRQKRPSRGPKPSLSLDRMVQAAVELADREGLDALSMSRLATSLGFTTMSLYRYVSSKDELLDLMVDEACTPPPAMVGGVETWRADLERWADAELTMLEQHSWVLQLMLASMPFGPRRLAWLDAGLQALAGTGLTVDEKAATILLLDGYVRAAARQSSELGTPPVPDDPSDPAALSYGAVLGQLIDPTQFPALSAALEAGMFDGGGEPYGRDEFDWGLQRILDGIEVLVASRLPPATPRRRTPARPPAKSAKAKTSKPR